MVLIPEKSIDGEWLFDIPFHLEIYKVQNPNTLPSPQNLGAYSCQRHSLELQWTSDYRFLIRQKCLFSNSNHRSISTLVRPPVWCWHPLDSQIILCSRIDSHSADRPSTPSRQASDNRDRPGPSCSLRSAGRKHNSGERTGCSPDRDSSEGILFSAEADPSGQSGR